MDLKKGEHGSIIEYIYKDFGYIGIRINELMDSRGISVNRMADLSNVQHRIVKKYYEQKAVRIDLEILAKFCFVLKCDISDVLYYEPPTYDK